MFHFRLKLASAFFDNPEFIYEEARFIKQSTEEELKKTRSSKHCFKLNRSKVD